MIRHAKAMETIIIVGLMIGAVVMVVLVADTRSPAFNQATSQ
jgi:hypothetical protein